MSLDYDKIKRKQDEGGNQWTSYSDLFMVLSFVFLLLYVVSSIRSGTHSIQKKIQFSKIEHERNDLKQQIQVYNTLKDQYLKEQASKDEQDTYEQLMDKLSLLQDEQKKEKDDLRQKAMENEKKEMALNHYQQLIRNIINTNLLAKKRLKRRDVIIDKKNVVITEQKNIIDIQRADIEEKTNVIAGQESIIGQKEIEIAEKKQIIAEKEEEIQQKTDTIDQLEKDLSEKRNTILENTQRIASIENDLAKKIENIKSLRNKNKKNRIKYNAQIAQLRRQSEKEIDNLKTKNVELSQDLSKIDQDLKTATNQLTDANITIEEQKREQEKLLSELDKVEQEYQQQLSQLKSDHVKKVAEEKEKFDKELEGLKLSQAEKEKKAQEFAKTMAQKEDDLKKKIASLNSQYENAANQLDNVKENLDQVEKTLQKELNEKNRIAGNLEDAKKRYQEELDSLRKEQDKKLAAERGAFEKALQKQRLSAKDKADKLAEFNRQMEAKQKALEGSLQDLKRKVSAAEQEAERSVASVEKLSKEKGELEKDLEQAKKNISIKRELAKKIQENFKKAGISADVDPRSGEVVLSFGKEYFDAGSSDLKNNMKDTIKKFIPSYTESLLGDKNIADKVASVELVGFASPTYRGKYIDPTKLDDETRNAVSYNMDLSFQRAKAIFNYMFDPSEMDYKYQNKVKPLVKVTGKSFLAEGAQGRDVTSGISADQYCKQYDCKKSQRVIIKFNLKD